MINSWQLGCKGLCSDIKEHSTLSTENYCTIRQIIMLSREKGLQFIKKKH